jgi:hypothetical protein
MNKIQEIHIKHKACATSNKIMQNKVHAAKPEPKKEVAFEQKLAEVKEIADNPGKPLHNEIKNKIDYYICPVTCNLLTEKAVLIDGKEYTPHLLDYELVLGILHQGNKLSPLDNVEFKEENLHYFHDISTSPDFQNAINEAYNIIHPEEDGNVKVAGGSAFAGSDSV